MIYTPSANTQRSLQSDQSQTLVMSDTVIYITLNISPYTDL